MYQQVNELVQFIGIKGGEGRKGVKSNLGKGLMVNIHNTCAT